MELPILSLIIIAGVVFAILAVTLGVDTREGSDDPRRPAGIA
jgi:hypothetical protein